MRRCSRRTAKKRELRADCGISNYDNETHFQLEKIMKPTLIAFSLLLGGIFATGCGGKAEPETDAQDSAQDTAVEDTAVEITIPDPGTEDERDRWYDDGGYHGTPDKAQVMGVVLDTPSYIQGGIDPETGNHYFVFRTAANVTEFEVSLYNKSSKIKHVHIHEGTGLVFGDEVPAKNVISNRSARWDLEPDTIYILEVHSPNGGFF